ncbi:MAG: preprotein translocase subunit SecE [Pirellulales bacterium]
MQKDKQSAASPLLRDLLSLEIYKRSQGRIARQVTFAVLAITIGIGAWRLSEHFKGDPTLQYYVPLAILLVGGFLAFRAVCIPKVADFLISVEAEMAKVSWPTRSELIRQSIVVLVTIFILAFLLFTFDLVWATLFKFLGVVGEAKK